MVLEAVLTGMLHDWSSSDAYSKVAAQVGLSDTCIRTKLPWAALGGAIQAQDQPGAA